MSACNYGESKTLKDCINEGTFVIAPGVYDMISARIADRMGFHAIYMTGYGVTASNLGLPDAGLATYTDMLDRAATIAAGTQTPLIADADTGYGGLLNVRHTIRGYERAGVQAIQIEDQEMPKKCGHTLGRSIIPAEQMVMKIKVAVDTRQNPDMQIIARTDARTTRGIQEAIDRVGLYIEAGADIGFVESPESEEELALIGKAIDAPLLANMVPYGRTPVVKDTRLQEMGYNIAIYPSLGMSAAAAAVQGAFEHLMDNGSTTGIKTQLFSDRMGADRMHELMGFPEIWEFERRWNQLAQAHDANNDNDGA